MATPDDCTNATPEHMFGHVLRPDELLRHVRYDFAEPCTDLAPWIDQYWSVEWDLAPGKIFHTRDRGRPGGEPLHRAWGDRAPWHDQGRGSG
ncbi:MAG: hypothetical protein IPH03_01985 [Tetrasphaera sp.]|nr:hypothetical protein [Tetrasphaera sp.]